ncbi:hypothetical protein ACROYT_G016199 [Oculina patagonica]
MRGCCISLATLSRPKHCNFSTAKSASNGPKLNYTVVLASASDYEQSLLLSDLSRPVEAAPDIPATAATGTPITIPTPVSEVATAPEDRAAVTAPRQTTE